MRTYYPHVDHAVPDCSGLSGWGDSDIVHDFSKADKKAFAAFGNLTDVKPGINALVARMNELQKLLAKVADGYTDSETGGYDFW